MRDYAKEVTHKGYKDGVAVMPFWQHELSMRKEASKTKKLIGTAAVALIASNLAWLIITRKH